MRALVAVVIVLLLPSLTLAQPLLCVPRAGAQDAIPLPPNGNCPWGLTRSGSFCLRSGGGR